MNKHESTWFQQSMEFHLQNFASGSHNSIQSKSTTTHTHGHSRLISALITNSSKLSSTQKKFMLDWVWRNYQLLSQKAAPANDKRDEIDGAAASFCLAIVPLQLQLPSVHCTCHVHKASQVTSFAAMYGLGHKYPSVWDLGLPKDQQ